jgi:enolase
MMNVLNGGKHAGNGVAIQEFMIYPLGFKSFSEALCAGSEIYHTLHSLIAKKYGPQATAVGDEGGFAPPCKSTDEALQLLESAIEELGCQGKVKLAMDAASSSFYDAKSSRYSIDGKKISADELSDMYVSLSRDYPIVSMEDPFDEESFPDFAALKKRLTGKVQIVADDLTVTNVSRLQIAIKAKSLGALLLKVNQVGTLSEALDAANLCRKNRLGVVVSHRSGETEDASIADIAVGIGCGQIKTGAPCRAERTAKYNRLLQIEEELGARAYAGASGLVL